MNTDTDASVQTKVYTRSDGRVAIEQSDGATVVITAQQILTVIRELHVCYDYCAVWKDQAEES